MIKDFFGNDASKLIDKKLFLLDMDGTIYNENNLFEGSKEFIDLANTKGKAIFLTNNSSRSGNAYVEKLSKMGIKAKREDIFSSIDATVIMLKEKYPNARVYAQGTKSFIEELIQSGIKVTTEIEDDIDLVLTGFDTELTFDKLNKTCEILSKRDIPYYATNQDLVCPVNYGFVPDNGSVAIMIKNATGKMPINIGKPEKTMIELVCQKFGYTKEETIIIGDRLYTDIASGINAGVDTICVLSGESTLEDLKVTEFKPTFIFKDIQEILETIKK